MWNDSQLHPARSRKSDLHRHFKGEKILGFRRNITHKREPRSRKRGMYSVTEGGTGGSKRKTHASSLGDRMQLHILGKKERSIKGEGRRKGLAKVMIQHKKKKKNHHFRKKKKKKKNNRRGGGRSAARQLLQRTTQFPFAFNCRRKGYAKKGPSSA